MMFWVLSMCYQNFTSKEHFIKFSCKLCKQIKKCCRVTQEMKSEILSATGIFYANEFYLQFNIKNNDEND